MKKFFVSLGKGLKKYTSRKFILSTVGAVGSIATAVSGVGGKFGTVAGYVAGAAITINYVINERKLDAASIKTLTTDISAIVDAVKDALDRKDDKDGN